MGNQQYSKIVRTMDLFQRKDDKSGKAIEKYPIGKLKKRTCFM